MSASEPTPSGLHGAEVQWRRQASLGISGSRFVLTSQAGDFSIQRRPWRWSRRRCGRSMKRASQASPNLPSGACQGGCDQPPAQIPAHVTAHLARPFGGICRGHHCLATRTAALVARVWRRITVTEYLRFHCKYCGLSMTAIYDALDTLEVIRSKASTKSMMDKSRPGLSLTTRGYHLRCSRHESLPARCQHLCQAVEAVGEPRLTAPVVANSPVEGLDTSPSSEQPGSWTSGERQKLLTTNTITAAMFWNAACGFEIAGSGQLCSG